MVVYRSLGGTVGRCPLPFLGSVCDVKCQGVKLNYGLHTQCQNGRVEGGDYCVRCSSESVENGLGTPSHGDIRDRAREGAEHGYLEYTVKGKQTLPLANVMKKLGLKRSDVEAYAAQSGVEIPDAQWELRVLRRGRPKKTATAVLSTTSVGSRVTSSPKSDLLAALHQAADYSDSESEGSECVSSVADSSSTTSQTSEG